ncbi:phage tail spike protein [Planococcus koreensis]|uniref:phage tail spike protein n=1 Tax=Planococcus koreensis TaxID=112331 RepID=UPI0039FC6FD6
MSTLHALHHQTDRLLAYLDNTGNKLFWDDKHVEGLDGEHHFEFKMLANIEEAEHFDELSRILVPLEDGGFEEFIVYQTEVDMRNVKQVYAMAAYTDMNKDYLMNIGTYNGTLRELVALALPSTEWVINAVETNEIRTIHLANKEGVYKFLKRIASAFEMEMRFRTETVGNRIRVRYVDFVQKRGFHTKKEIEFGKDLADIKKRVFNDRIVTALEGRGPERDDGTFLTSYVFDEDAFQRWNRRGKHRVEEYVPESDNQDMTQTQLDQYTRTELNKRIASVVEYEITAASIEALFPHEKVRLGDRVRVKNPEFSPPLYADARIIRVERSILDKGSKVYTIGEVKTYTEEEVMRTFRVLQRLYGVKLILSSVAPSGQSNAIWVNTGTSLNVPHTFNVSANQWEKFTPTEAAEIGAETPQGAQIKADAAEESAKSFATTEIEAATVANEAFVQDYAQSRISQNLNPPEFPKIDDIWIDISSGSPVWKKWDGNGWAVISKTTLAELGGVLAAGQIAVGGIAAVHLGNGAITEVKVSNGAITNTKLADLAIDAAKLAEGAVTGTKISDGAVTTTKILDNAINNAKIAAGAVTELKIGNGAITTTKLADLAVDAAKLKDSAVTSTKIANLAVGTAAIADAAITNAKIQSLDAAKITTGLLKAELIGANTITVDKLHVLARNRVNSPTLSGSKEGWTVHSGLSVINDATRGNVFSLSNSGNVVIYSDTFEISPKSFLKIAAGLKTSGTVDPAARFHFGIQVMDKDSNLLNVTPVKADRTKGAASGNVYFYVGGVNMTLSDWIDIGGFLLPHDVDLKTIPEPDLLHTFSSTTGPYLILPPNAAKMRLRFLNYYGATNSTYLIHDPSVTDVYGGAITANQIVAGTITANEMKAGTITAASGILADAVITSAKIANLAVGTAAIADLAVTSAKIQALDAAKITTGTLDANRIAANSITAAKIAGLTITAAQLAADSIIAEKIATGAVTADAIAANSITSTMINTVGLDAGVIKFGTMSGDRIAANSIKADRLVAGSITGDMISGGTIAGVTFTSGLGTSRYFVQTGGTATFTEEFVYTSSTHKYVTKLNDNGISSTFETDGFLDSYSNLNNEGFLVGSNQFNNASRLKHDALEMNFGLTHFLSVAPNSLNMGGDTTSAYVGSRKSLNLSGNGQSLLIDTEALMYNGNPIGLTSVQPLWSGVLYLHETHTITPSRKLSECPNGWILVWSRYTNGAAQNSDWNTTYIPRRAPNYSSNTTGANVSPSWTATHWCPLPAAAANDDAQPPIAHKAVYVTDSTIKGHRRNGIGTQTGQVLRYVYPF